MADVAIILNNSGNNVYAQAAREFLISPIRADLLKVLLTNPDQVNNLIKIRNNQSVGTASNRDIQLINYISAMSKTNQIIDIPLDPPLLLDGQTSFQVVLEPLSEIILLFYFEQKEIVSMLQ